MIFPLLRPSPSRAGRYAGSTTITASRPVSAPCFGASAGSFNADRTTPIGRTTNSFMNPPRDSVQFVLQQPAVDRAVHDGELARRLQAEEAGDGGVAEEQVRRPPE